jgi:hypothetical protein
MVDERTLAVVDVRDDRDVAELAFVGICHVRLNLPCVKKI